MQTIFECSNSTLNNKIYRYLRDKLKPHVLKQNVPQPQWKIYIPCRINMLALVEFIWTWRCFAKKYLIQAKNTFP